MIRDWLWDKNISINRVKDVLKDSSDRRFLYYSALLLSRKSSPREVFKLYLNPEIFYDNWQRIKRVMQKNRWADTSIEFWQAIYEKLKEKYKSKRRPGIKEKKTVEPVCKRIGENIRKIRKEKKLTQKQLARRLKVSQQIISRIEKGYENSSLVTLRNVASALDVEIELFFKSLALRPRL